MKGRWKSIIILLALVLAVKVECDDLGELVKKVDKVIMEQIKANERVEKLQSDFDDKISKIEEKFDKAIEAIIQKFAKALEHKANNKTFNQLNSDIKSLNLDMSSKSEISSSIEDMDNYIHNSTGTTVTPITTTTTTTTTSTQASTTSTTTTTTTSEVIMITGGYGDAGKLVELLYPNGTHICELESLPDKNYAHTQSGLLLCGGKFLKRYCLIFAGGSWKKHGKYHLRSNRWYHKSWKLGDIVMLIGGHGSWRTSETISLSASVADNYIYNRTGTGVHQATFNLKHPLMHECIISLKNSFVLTGGDNSITGGSDTVTQYNYGGLMRELPVLNEGRNGHGCGFYVNNEHKIVLLVAGGHDGSSTLSSTEMLFYDDPKSWTWGKALPYPWRWPVGVSVGNRFLLIGGGSGVKDVVMLTEDGKNWNETGAMKYARAWHAASTVPEETVEYCK